MLLFPGCAHIPQNLAVQGSNFTRKMRVKKAISEVVFSLLAFSYEWKFVAVIRGSYPSYKSSLQFPKMSFIDDNCFPFYPSENHVNGRSLHWILSMRRRVR